MLRDAKMECESSTWEDSLEVAQIIGIILYQVQRERVVMVRPRDDDDDWLEEQQAGSK